MAPQRITDDFKKTIGYFVTLRRASGHRPTTALLISNIWSSKEREASQLRLIERMKVSEDHFKNTITLPHLRYAQFHPQSALMEVE